MSDASPSLPLPAPAPISSDLPAATTTETPNAATPHIKLTLNVLNDSNVSDAPNVASKDDENSTPKINNQFEAIFGGDLDSDDEDDLGDINEFLDSSEDEAPVSLQKKGKKKQLTTKKKSTAESRDDRAADSEDGVDVDADAEDVETRSDLENDLTFPVLPKFKKSKGAKAVKRQMKEKRTTKRKHREDTEVEVVPDILMTEEEKRRIEADRIFNGALQALKTKRRKRSPEDLDAADDILQDLFRAMRRSADIDSESNRARRPAMQKLDLLKDVVDILNKPAYSDAILENEGLSVIRLWLEPFQDGALPSIDIQRALLDILDKLPLSADHLRSSGVGKVVFFYSKCPHIQPDIKKLSMDLVNKWIRPIIGRSANYRHMGQRSPLRNANTLGATREGVNDEDMSRARIPRSTDMAFEVAPRSSIRRESRSGKDQTDPYRRLKTAMTRLKGPSKA